MYLLIHTMTITESDYVAQAQFFHTFSHDAVQINDVKLIGRRFSFRVHPELCVSRSKLQLQHLTAPSLKTLMKRNSAHVKHHLRTIHIGNANRNNQIQTDATIVSPPVLPSPNTASEVSEPVVETNNTLTDYLPAGATPQQTSQWLTANRFEKYLDTFSSFAAADMLRMSKEDFVQICGQADGIRLYNALHLKTIAPKLTIYVCRENTTIFNAIFLSAHNNVELMQKLASVIGVPQEQIRDIYIQGPRSIHIHINNDVIRHIKEETIFSLEIIQDNGSYILLLKPTVK